MFHTASCGIAHFSNSKGNPNPIITKESFRNIALKIKEVQKVPSSTAKDDQLAMYTNKLCVHINAVYRCWSDFIDVLGGLNQIRSVHGFLGMSDSDEDEEESDDIMHKPSMEGSDWADNLNEEEIDPTSKLLKFDGKINNETQKV
mgnify:CR=1 FL=1